MEVAVVALAVAMAVRAAKEVAAKEALKIWETEQKGGFFLRQLQPFAPGFEPVGSFLFHFKTRKICVSNLIVLLINTHCV